MRLLTRLTRAIAARLGPGTQAQGKTREELRALAGMADEDVRACLKSETSGRDAAGLLAYYRARRLPSPLFRPSDRKELVHLVAERFPESYKETLRLADLACRHVVEVLGSGPTDLGDPINWWTDFKGGTWAQGDYQELNATLYANDFQNERYIGDIKLPWELNKHAHFLELAKAYWLTGDERYAEALLAQMDDWIARSPFLDGIAWTQNLIVAQRAIAWALALQAVWQSPALTPARLLRILRSLYQHARYIPAHFEFAERASNHLFGNAAGLAALALVFPEFRDAETWRATALRVIESELAKQVYPDGVQYEQSVNYHRYVVEFSLLPWLLAWPQPSPYSAAAQAALRRMATFLLHMTQPNGQVQPISDADGARVWRFNDQSINDHRGVLNLGAVLFKDGALRFGMDGNREDVLWWLGPEGYHAWETLPAEEPPRSVAFPDGGYFVLREAWRPEALWVFFDCGYVGMGDWPDEVSVGTHGHSDLLTFGFAAGGETFLTDIGSYTYTGSRPWHDYFRSARGHNVMLVDEQDQSVLTTTWAMRERARPREVAWRFSPDVDFVTGAHDGYRRLSPPVLHRRSLLLLRAERCVIIRDDLEGVGSHAVEALFHAMPAVRVLQADRPDSWKLISRRVSVSMTFLAESLRHGQPLPLSARVASGETNPIDGWYADDYGVKESAPVLHVSFRGPCPLRLYTVLQLDAPGRSAAPGAWSTFHGADEAWDAVVKGLGLSQPSRTIVMLVTNEGLTDPRVLRSMQTAHRAGFEVRLVCRALASKKEEVIPPGVHVHRVPPLWGRRLLKRLLSRPAPPETVALHRTKDERPGFWLKPWELWILGGIAWFNLQAVRQLWRLPAALYHANDLDTLPAGVILSRWNRVSLLYDAHELFAVQFPGCSRQFRAILLGLERWLIRFAHKVVTVNDSIAETLAEWHRAPKPTVVLNCPLAVEAVRSEANGFEEAHAGKARVIYQGVYVRDRGLEELILSAAWYDSADLYLRGYGELEPALRALVRAKGLEGRVHFLPPVPPARLVQSLAGFDVGVVSYRPTTLNNRLCLPNKAFEYLQAGLALAVSALPELRRLVDATGAGELFDPDSPEDIARGVNALTRDAGRLAALKARALAAGQRLTWETQGEPTLMACYQELAGSAPAGRMGAR
jgi:glycosyltransferase involved in cell wall biosynthesis